MGDIDSPRKIVIYDKGDNLKVFVGERELAYTVKKSNIR
jgi:ribosomal protein S6